MQPAFDTAPRIQAVPVMDQRASLDAYDEITPEDLAEEEEFWGPRGVDPGGDPVQMGKDDQGAFVILAGRRVPVLLVGDVAQVGIRGRGGRCAEFAQEAVWRVLAERGDTAQGVSMCFGRAWGAATQTWVDFYDEGRWQVYDLTVSDEPFARSDYLTAIHGVLGTRLPMPFVATLRAFTHAVRDGYWLYGRRAETLSPQALVQRQQKES